MKISNSKKQLAKIIHENGGWVDGAEFSAQDKDGEVFHYATKPSIDKGSEVWGHKGCIGYGEFPAKTLPNWHQTILSRDAYFHLYPVAEPAPAQIWINPPTIEQLAADYRNRKDYADRKQQEADAAKADAEAKLAELVAAGKALGFVPVSAVRPAIDGCMRLVDMVPTRLQTHQDESIAAIGYVVNVERLYDTVREAAELIKGDTNA